MLPALAAAHAAVLIAMPTVTVIAIGVWWNANTIAHNFIHRPFFRRPVANQAFAAALSVLNGIPQSLWRDRHLAHHAQTRPGGPAWAGGSGGPDRAGRLAAPKLARILTSGGGSGGSLSREACLQSVLVLSVWAAVAARSPRFFLTTYLPGYLAGLFLCALHGYYEHARGTTSYYGRLYNFLLFNDGYHVEHHANPNVPWRELPARRAAAATTSAWPAPLRWMERAGLDWLERLVLRSSLLQRFVLTRHARAWRRLLPSLGPVGRLTILGGGLFPRTALIARQLLPAAHITIVDASAGNLDLARRLLDSPTVALVHERYAGGACGGCDLLVVPLSFDGNREAIYAHPPAPAVIVHDWIWRRRGTSCIVSIALLKRMNLVRIGSGGSRRPGGSGGLVGSLFFVFVVAKVAALAGRQLPLSWWAPLAYFWQDALVVLAYAAVDAALGARRRVASALYGALAFYAVFNIPVVRAVSTPLTAAMWRAARGPLADSIWIYATWQNALLCAAAFASGCVAPLACRRASRRMMAALAVCVLLGPLAAARTDTLGLERNAWTALAASLLPHVDARESIVDVRASGFDHIAVEDLSLTQDLVDGSAGAAAGRDIVLVSLESTAAAYLGIYGAQPDVMPNLSALARTAIVFDNAYAVYPESIKGLYSILCSAYPSFDSRAELYAALPCHALPAALRDAGYSTALFHSGRFMYLGMEAVVANRGYETLEDAADIGGLRTSSFGVDEPSTIARMLAWIDKLPANRRFFLTYLPIAGHHPYETAAAGPFQEHDDFARYRNAVHAGDAALGTLMRGLEARGRRENTLWIVVGDHGEAFGQHAGNYGHTFHLYEENVRVPFLIAAPGLATQQRHSRRVVSLIDTAPTVLELAGIRQPSGYQGASILHGDARLALFFTDYSMPMVGLRDGATKFIYELDSGRARMFDLDKDPGERLNLAGANAGRASDYEQLLRAWAAAEKHRLTEGARRSQ